MIKSKYSYSMVLSLSICITMVVLKPILHYFTGAVNYFVYTLVFASMMFFVAIVYKRKFLKAGLVKKLLVGGLIGYAISFFLLITLNVLVTDDSLLRFANVTNSLGILTVLTAYLIPAFFLLSWLFGFFIFLHSSFGKKSTH